MTTYHIEESGQYKALATIEADSPEEAWDRFRDEFPHQPDLIKISYEVYDTDVWETKPRGAE